MERMVGKKTLLVVVFLLSIIIVPISAELMPRDFYIEVAKGNIPGHVEERKYGQSTEVQTTWTTIWENNTRYPWAALDAIIPTAFSVSSTDANDAAGDTGAWNVTIIGLDTNWVEQNETVQLNGQNQVLTTLQYTRINHFYIREAGATGSNEGFIYAGTGVAVAGVPPNIFDLIGFFNGVGSGRALTTVYSVPCDHTLFITNTYHITGESKEIEVALHYRWYGEGWIFRYISHLFQTDFEISMYPQLRFPGQTDLCMCTRGDVKGGHISAGWEGVLIDNSVLGNSTLTWADGSASDVVVSSSPPDPTPIYAAIIAVLAGGALVVALVRRR